MTLHNTTPVPNAFFEHIPALTHTELRVLLVVIRQTYGWKNAKTGERKTKDRMSYEYIIKKTGLYRTILSETIHSLIDMGLLLVTDGKGNAMHQAHQRKGKRILFYQFQPVRSFDSTCSELRTAPIRSSEHNKRNTSKKRFLQKENLEKLKMMQQHLLEHLKRKFG